MHYTTRIKLCLLIMENELVIYAERAIKNVHNELTELKAVKSDHKIAVL